MAAVAISTRRLVPARSGPPNVVIQLFDGSGTRIAETSFTPQAWPRTEQPYALRGSPDAGSLLLAWSSIDIDPSVPGNAQTYITRFDCSDAAGP